MSPKTKLSSIPLYQQVRQSILIRIIAGEWTPGSFLPSEIALAKEYGVSQGTLRKALDALTIEKRLVRYQGRGTAVAVMNENSDMFPFFPLSDRAGNHVYPASRTYNVEKAPASDEERAALKLDEGAMVIRLHRVRMLDKRPVIHQRVSLPLERFPSFTLEPELVPNTLYEYYQLEFGITVSHAVDRIEVGWPDAADVKVLGVSQDQPLLFLSRVSHDLQGEPVEFRASRISTTDYVYCVELH